MKALLFLSVVLVAIGCAQPVLPVDERLPEKAPGRYTGTLKAGDVDRGYVLRVPKAYNATARLPLVVLLHGLSGSAAMVEGYTGFAAKADREGFFLVSPEGLGRPQGWNAGFIDLSGRRQDDVAFLNALLDQIEKEVGVDPDRIYFAGHSNGGMMSHLIGSRLSDRVAAVGVVAGILGVRTNRGLEQVPDPAGPVSVMMIHGRRDPLVDYGDGLGLLKGVGSPDAARWWAERIGASKTPVVSKSENGNVITETFNSGRNGTSVVLVTIENGLHDWPGGLTARGAEALTGVNATDLLWDFFKAHPKKRGL
jgi:polyhydroxybutyrate depolymerase